MSMTLVEALRQVRLEPGATRARVDGFEVEVRVSRTPTAPDPLPDDIADQVMVDIWLDVPPDPAGRVVIAHRGELSPLDPVVIDPYWEEEAA